LSGAGACNARGCCKPRAERAGPRTKPVGVGRLFSSSHSPPTTMSVVLRLNTLRARAGASGAGCRQAPPAAELAAGRKSSRREAGEKAGVCVKHRAVLHCWVWRIQSGSRWLPARSRRAGCVPVHGHVQVAQRDDAGHDVQPPEQRQREHLGRRPVRGWHAVGKECAAAAAASTGQQASGSALYTQAVDGASDGCAVHCVRPARPGMASPCCAAGQTGEPGPAPAAPTSARSCRCPSSAGAAAAACTRSI